jgi:hypothetical protein
MRAGLAGGGARKVTLIPVGANAGWYKTAGAPRKYVIELLARLLRKR